MPKKRQIAPGLGPRIREIRRAKGMSQTDLATAARTTQRTISHYETGRASPTAFMLAALAKALVLSIDDLMGVTKHRSLPTMDAATTRLWNRFRRIRALPEAEQRAVFKVVDMALKLQGIEMDEADRNGSRRRRDANG